MTLDKHWRGGLGSKLGHSNGVFAGYLSVHQGTAGVFLQGFQAGTFNHSFCDWCWICPTRSELRSSSFNYYYYLFYLVRELSLTGVIPQSCELVYSCLFEWLCWLKLPLPYSLCRTLKNQEFYFCSCFYTIQCSRNKLCTWLKYVKSVPPTEKKIH